MSGQTTPHIVFNGAFDQKSIKIPLNHLNSSQMDFPIYINLTSLFLFKVCGVVLYRNSNRTFCKQTVETLTRRSVLRRLVWDCIVCQRTLGVNGLHLSLYEQLQFRAQLSWACERFYNLRLGLGPNCLHRLNEDDESCC